MFKNNMDSLQQLKMASPVSNWLTKKNPKADKLQDSFLSIEKF